MEVDWPALIRRRAEVVDLFVPGGTNRFVARNGPAQVLDQLREMKGDRPVAITGSFAAVRLAPVAAPALLVLYATEPRAVAADLALMPVEFGADVIVVRPENDVVFQRSQSEGRLRWAAPSQVAIDCLSGVGRMPAEGEALIDWMRANEETWRVPSIRSLLEAVGG